MVALRIFNGEPIIRSAELSVRRIYGFQYGSSQNGCPSLTLLPKSHMSWNGYVRLMV